MNWKLLTLSLLGGAALTAGLLSGGAAGGVGAAGSAFAAGDMSGSLGTGGVCRGDISMQSDETDRLTIDLEQGAAFTLVFSSTFQARLAFLDPDGASVDLGFTTGRKVRIPAWTVTKTGTYRFEVSSADGTQGLYTLTAKQSWPKTIKVTGAGTLSVDVPMPVQGKISAKISRQRNAPGQPRILSLLTPALDDLLPAPIEAKKNTVKMPPVETTIGGTYSLSVGTTDGVSPWLGKVTRIAPHLKPQKVGLANGLDQISFSGAEIDTIFQRRCAGCHGWAASYSGVRSYAGGAISKIKSGSMPPDVRLPADQVALIDQWIKTGRAR